MVCSSYDSVWYITTVFNVLHVDVLGTALTAEEKSLLAQTAKERADIIDRYDKVTILLKHRIHARKVNAAWSIQCLHADIQHMLLDRDWLSYYLQQCSLFITKHFFISNVDISNICMSSDWWMRDEDRCTSLRSQISIGT